MSVGETQPCGDKIMMFLQIDMLNDTLVSIQALVSRMLFAAVASSVNYPPILNLTMQLNHCISKVNIAKRYQKSFVLGST